MISQQFNKEDELKLIKKYQDTKDPMILRELRRVFAGTIQDAIKKSNTYGLDPRSLDQKALVAFGRAIDQYKPSAGTKPNTYITNRIVQHLNNENYEFKNKTRLTQDDTILQSREWTIRQNLQAQGLSATDADVAAEINRTSSNKNRASVDVIQRIQGLNRDELSGDRLMGASGEGEDITFTDVYNTGMTGGQAIRQRDAKSVIMAAYNTLTEQEKRLVKDRNPGLFSDGLVLPNAQKDTSWKYVAINNGYSSEHFAKQAYKKAEDKMRAYINAIS